MPEELEAAGAGGPVVRALVGRPRRALVGVRLDGRRPRLRLRLRRLNLGAAEEGAEHAVVGLEIVPAPDEGRSPRPVQLLRRQQRSRTAERLDAAGADGEALRPERSPEPDEELGTARDERRLGHAQVLPVLDGPAERLEAVVALHRLEAEQCERLRPVDRLRGAGRLDEVELTQPGDRLRDGAGKPFRDLRRAHADDLDLALEVGELDPVVEAAPLEGVVQLARPVGRHDDRRRLGGRDPPELPIVTLKSERTSSRNASNSSSARSSSSTSSTAPAPDRIARSGRSTRNSGPYRSTAPPLSVRVASSCRE